MTDSRTTHEHDRAIHPLEPLNADELRTAISILRREAVLGERVLFEQVSLREPPKALVAGFASGTEVPREAFAVVLDRTSGKTYEATISLSDGTLKSWRHKPGVQPWIMAEELEEAASLLEVDSDYRAGLRKRGIEDFEKVHIDMLAVGNFGAAEEQTHRLLRLHSFYVEDRGDNPHVRPIEGLVPVVDLNAMQVLTVEDEAMVPIPPERGDYGVKGRAILRKPLAKLEISQPDGPGFTVDGHAVSWERWSFRVGFTQREGLVLHTLSFRDDSGDRPIIYRASLSELVVPYAETRGDYYRNHSFDAGEGGLGNSVNSLRLGCDCLGEIYYFDVNMATGRGEVVTKPNAICMHEEDYGVLWKHTNPRTGIAEVRRSRRLVISSFFTVGNYDYGLFWYLYLDGTIQFEAKLTGVLYCGALEDGEVPPYGRVVAPNVNAMIHEHYFNVRLDMNVDGAPNTALEVEAELVPTGPDNPHGNAHGARERVLESELSAARDIKPELGRCWKVVNRTKTNRLGRHPGYRLVPGWNVKPLHQPGSPFMKRAGFVAHDLWVTAYDRDEMYAPGAYVNQNSGGPGLPEWTAGDRPIVDTDIVLWHTVGVFHVPRPEDFPIMPVEYAGFLLKPDGFFERNPALDLPPPDCHV